MTVLTQRTRITIWLAPTCAAIMAGLLLIPPKYAVLLVLAAAGSWIVLARPWRGVIGLAVLLPFNNLGSELLGTGSAATAFGAVKDGLLALLLVAAVNRRTVRRDLAPFVIAVAVLGLVGFAYATSISTGLYGWRNDYEPVLLLLAVAGLLTPDQARSVKTTIAVMAQAAALIGVVTWHRGISWLYSIHVASPGVYPFQYFSSGNYRPRAFSPMAGPNELGAYLDIALAVIVTRTDWSIRRRAALCVLPLVGIYLARSRSGLIGVVLLAAVCIIRTARSRFGIGTILTIAVAAAAVPFLSNQSGDLSLTGHATSLQTGLGNALTHPLGYGLGNVGPRAILTSQNPVLVESFWLLMALESGLLVLVAYLLLLTRTVRLTARAGDGFLAAALLASVIVSQLVLPSMQDGPVSFTFWLVLALAVNAQRPPYPDPKAKVGRSHAGAGVPV